MSATGTIGRDELRQKIDAGDSFHLFEVLPEPYYRKHHLPGARLLLPTAVESTIQEQVPDKNAEVILYCWDEH